MRRASLLAGIVVIAAHAPGIPRNGHIAFVTVQQIAGSGVVAISPGNAHTSVLEAAVPDAPTVPSPDGSRLALGVDGSVLVVGSDGKQGHTVGEGRSPTWSPDGSRLAFVGATGQIEIAAATGGQPRDLGVSGTEPVWSPTGEWIAFYSGYTTLELIHADGTGRRLLASDAYSPDSLPLIWAHDGAWLAFGAVPAGANVLELDVIRPDGTGRRSLGSGVTPAWSPRSDVLAYESADNGFEIAAPDGSVRLSSDAVSGTPVWSPSGNGVAIGSPDSSGMWVVDPQTAATRRLSLSGLPTWSADGTQIAAIGRSALRVVTVGGGRPRVIARGAMGPALWLSNGTIAYVRVARIRSAVETDSGRVLLHGRTSFDIGQRVAFGGLVWAPDGSALAALYGSELRVTEADGSSSRVLARGVTEVPSWSPDGRRLAFAADGLRVVGSHGGAARLLTRVADVAPTWSPDGRHIAFESAGGVLYVIDPDGRRLRRLADDVSSAPSWSPDGKRVAFSVGDAYYPTAIETIRFDGGGRKTVASAPAAGDSGDVLFAPAWSPDGKTILYLDDVYLCGSKCDELHLMLVHPDGTAKRELRGFLNDPGWSPDGKELIGLYGDDLLAVVDVRTQRRRIVAVGTGSWSWQPLAP